jgi:hypothetical protein
MLRPISGWSGGPPTHGDDGSVMMCISLRHAVPETVIRRGQGHEVAFRIVEEGGGWRIDTDLLRSLIDGLGTLEEVVRPLAEQVG